MSMDAVTIETDENDGATCSSKERGANGSLDVVEMAPFLPEQAFNGNGSHADARNRGNNDIGHRESAVCRVKRELNENVFHRVRLWMIIVSIFIVIAVVTILTLVVCAAIHEDEDAKYDSSLFKVPHNFSGSFRMPNFVFTEELLTPSSSENQALTAKLQSKLADLYTSSPALGRYFSKAEIQAFRFGSVIVDYTLMFKLPEEELDQLRNFTLSRETVFNVFRQFLYDQELTGSDPTYIDPDSLQMYLRH